MRSAMSPLGLPFESHPGLGNEEYPGFPADVCPEELPDLSKHFSVTAELLKGEPGLYEKLRVKRTALGVGLAKVIKTGMDNRGHPMIKALGSVAGDAECFDTFAPLFDKLIAGRHGDGSLSTLHSESPGRRMLTSLPAEPFEGYLVSCQARAARNLEGLRFPPAADRAERCEVERVLVRALLELGGPLKGEYYPLGGSQTYSPKPGGMSEQDEKELSGSGFTFYHPDSTAVLSSGAGMHWPDARGVFVNNARTVAVWINEEEHFRATSMRKDGNVQAAFSELANLLENVESSLLRHGDCPSRFARSDRLGFLNACPANIGTALRVSAIMKLPQIKPLKDELNGLCRQHRLVVRGAVDETGIRLAGLVEVSNRDRLGITEEETVNLVVEGVADLIRAERLMEQGVSTSEALRLDRGDSLGRSPTPILADDDEEASAWATAGSTLSQMLSTAVVTSSNVPLKDIISADGREPLCTPDIMISEEVSAAQLQAPSKQSPKAAHQVGGTKKDLASDFEASSGGVLDVEPGMMVTDTRQQVSGQVLTKTTTDVCIRVDDDKDVWCEIEDLKDSQLISDAKDDELEQAIVTELQAKALQTLLAGMEWGSFEAACLDIKQENAAAIKIQAIRRGKVARAKAAEEAQQRQEETSAASRIQAIQRGKIQRRQAEKQRQDKEEAAAILKIQAVHRGKASRAQGEEKKKQKEVDAANAKKLQAAQTETTEDLMGSMRNTLETGLLDGSLEKVLAGEEPARTSEVPSTGDFRTLPADAWAVLHGRFSEAAQSSEAELRTMMATKLEAALKDGSLETALIKAQGTKPTEQALSMEEQKAKLRNILEVSLDNGSLEKELSRFQQAPSDLNDVRAKMASQLEACLKDGSLEQALASCAAESKDAPAQDNDMEDIRAKMAIQLEASLYDGKLEKALAAVTPKATPSQTLSVEEVRQSASTALLKGMTDGSLEAAITQAKNEKESKFNLNEVRDKIAKQLQASLDDGSLEAALAKVKAKSAASSEPNIDEMREKMAKQLEACLKDGSLETALAQAKAPELEPVPEPSLEDIRAKMAAHMEASLHDGSLDKAMRKVKEESQAAVNDDSKDDIRAKMAKQLEASLCDGSLGAALAQVKGTPVAIELEAERNNVASKLEAAATDGSLATALSKVNDQASPSSASCRSCGSTGVDFLGKVCTCALGAKAASQVTVTPSKQETCNSCVNTGIDVWGKACSCPLGAKASIGPKNLLADLSATSPAKPPVSPKVTLPAAKASQNAVAGAMALLKAISGYDRRIGLLTAQIQESERRILDQTGCCTQLEADVDMARQDCQSLDYELENQQRALDREDLRGVKLLDSQRRLGEDMEVENLKQRHANLDCDAGMWTARSELSTACTFNDGILSPFATTREALALNDTQTSVQHFGIVPGGAF